MSEANTTAGQLTVILGEFLDFLFRGKGLCVFLSPKTGEEEGAEGTTIPTHY